MKYSLDASHSSIQFCIKHLMFSTVKGRFEKFSGRMLFDHNRIEASSVEVEIEARSIATGDEKRDLELRSEQIFDVDRYPSLSFKSTRVSKSTRGVIVIGDLTIRDKSREVTLELERPLTEEQVSAGEVRLRAKASTVVRRKDFGLRWGAALEAGGILVDDIVKISVDVAFTSTGKE